MRTGKPDRSVFKAYDIRGLFPSQINEDMAWRVGYGLAQCPLIAGSNPRTIVVGRDARESADVLFSAFASGAAYGGAEIIDIGLSTTPMLYFAVNKLAAAGGAMITASHNPGEYNGFKLVRAKAIPMGSGAGLEDVRDIALSAHVQQGSTAKTVSQHDEILDGYTRFFAERFQIDLDSTVHIDTGNGATGAILPRILENQGIQYNPLFFEPDGRFPNHDANPLVEANLADLKAAVIADEQAVGLAFDGDGDRVCFVDGCGNAIRGDLITTLMAEKLLEANPGRTILYDLRSSRIVPQIIREAGGEPVRTRVGHAFIKQQMRELNALCAGELSYHFYFEDFFYCDGGIYAMLEVLDLLAKTGKSLDELVEPLRQYAHSGEINFEVGDVHQAMAEIERHFHDGDVSRLDGLSIDYADWWLNLRPSNTEPLLRLNLEAEREEIMKQRVKEITRLLARFQGGREVKRTVLAFVKLGRDSSS